MPHAAVWTDSMSQIWEQDFKEEVTHASYCLLPPPPPNVTPSSYRMPLHNHSSYSHTYTDPSAVAAVTKGK